MTLIIAQESPLTAEALALIKGSETALREVYSADECFSFDANELTASDVTFLVGRLDAKPLGCIALCTRKGYGEIKRLFVTPDARGTGAGRKLVEHLEMIAKDSGINLIRLETGERLAAGVSLYKCLGYSIRGPFGDYGAHPASLFMEKHI